MRARASCLLSFDFRNSLRPFAATRSCEQPQVRPEQQDRGAAPPQPVTSRRASSLTATPPGLSRRVTGVPPGPLARFCKGWRARAHGLHAPLRKAVSARTRQRCGRRTLLLLPTRLPRVPGGTQRALTLRITSKRGRVPARRFPERVFRELSVCAHHSQHGVLTLKSPRRCRSTPGALWQRRTQQIAAFLWRVRASTASPSASTPSSRSLLSLHRARGRVWSTNRTQKTRPTPEVRRSLEVGRRVRVSDTPPCSSPADLEHLYPNAGSRSHVGLLQLDVGRAAGASCAIYAGPLRRNR